MAIWDSFSERIESGRLESLKYSKVLAHSNLENLFIGLLATFTLDVAKVLSLASPCIMI